MKFTFSKLRFFQNLFLLFLISFIVFSCAKDDMEVENLSTNETPTEVRRSSTPYVGIRPVVLGPEINNPYALDIVNQANTLLYPGSPSLTATHKYVKFKPANIADVTALLEWSFDKDFVMFDFPLHYEILQTGDYFFGS